MRAIGELEDGRATLEVVAGYEPRPLELGEHPVHRREAELLAAIEQRAVDRLGGHVPLDALLQDLQHLEARRRDLEAELAKILSFHFPLVSIQSGMIAPSLWT